MAEKIFNTRVVNKHDLEANWNKAVNFIPLKGELIVYDVDEAHSYERIKIGDGVQNVNDLPFVDDALKAELEEKIAEIPQADWNQNDESAADYVKNRTHYEIPEVWTSLNIINNSDEHFYLDYALEKDKSYKLRVDGIVYSFDAIKQGVYHSVSGYYAWYLGAQPEIEGLNIVVNTWDYPFSIYAMGYSGPKQETEVYFEDGTTNHTVEVLESEAIVHTIAPKYIKDMYYDNEKYVPKTKTEIADIIREAGYDPFSSSAEIVEGITFTAVIDGVIYNNVPVYVGCYMAGGYTWGIGDIYRTSSSGNNWTTLDYGFSYGIYGCASKKDIFPNGIEKVEIYTLERDLKQIAPKYIKDMYHEEIKTLSETREFVADSSDGGRITDLEFAKILWKNRKIASYTANGETHTYVEDTYETETSGSFKTFGGGGNFWVTVYFDTGLIIFGEPNGAGNFADGSITVNYEVEEVHYLDPKYIKDMYYDNGVTITEVVPETTVEGFAVMQDPIYSIQNAISMTPVVGATYIVNWDGIEYTATCNSAVDIPIVYIGNGNYVTMQSGGDIPFAIIFINGDVFLSTESIASSHTISVAEYNHDLKQIDAKYLSILEKIEETIIKVNVTDFIELMGPEYGKLLGKYVVVIDGVSETVEFIDNGIGSFVETESFYLESWTDPEGNVDNNGFYIALANPDGNSHSVEIIAIKDIIKEEYLPDSVLAQPDWNQADETAVDYIKNKPEIATDDEIISMLTELDMLPVVTDSDGAILADESDNILLW